jgi:hypothetical protein
MMKILRPSESLGDGRSVALPSRAPPAAGPADRRTDRTAWVDNLRVVVIMGVIGAHVSLIYALDVGWYYEERTAGEVTTALLAGIFSPALVFGMGLLFFVAGLFTPAAIDRKGSRRFMIDRLWRLGVPVVAYLFMINPGMDYFGDRATGSQEGLGDYVRQTYSDDVALGIAWFILALLVFSFGYAGWRQLHPADRHIAAPLRHSDAIKAVGFIAVASFLVRLVWPFLGTDVMWGLNLWEYPQMITLFVLGAVATERGWLADGLSLPLRRTCGRAAAIGIAILAALGVAISLTDDPDPFLGGFRLEATIIPAAEAMIAVGMSLWTVDWFRRRWNRSGPIGRAMGRASFGAYLVHAPLTVVLAIAMRDVDVAAEAKLLAVFSAATIASYALGWVLTQSDVAGRIL